MSNPHIDEAVRIFEANHGILKVSQAVRLGIPKHRLYQMVAQGTLVREDKGIYRLSTSEPLSNPDFVQVSLQIPKAVICLFSALYHYHLTTQIPYAVHVALPNNYPKPRLAFPLLEVYRFSPKSLTSGIEEEIIDGVVVRIYNREKTIADCFKFRGRIGLDIAIEALKDYLKQPNPQIDEILRYARLNRVDRLVQIYLKALLT